MAFRRQSTNYDHDEQVLAEGRGLQLTDSIDDNGCLVFKVTKNRKVIGLFEGEYGWSDAEQLYTDELTAIIYKIKKR